MARDLSASMSTIRVEIIRDYRVVYLAEQPDPPHLGLTPILARELIAKDATDAEIRLAQQIHLQAQR